MINTADEELEECIMQLIAEYVESNVGAMHEEDFDDRLVQEVIAMIQAQFGPAQSESVQVMFSSPEQREQERNNRCENEIHVLHDEEELTKYVQQLRTNYFRFISAVPPREYSCTFTEERPDYTAVTDQLDLLRNVPQFEQRTKEWYDQRQNMITASETYKVFGSAAVRNTLIFSKCQNQGQEQQEQQTQAQVQDDIEIEPQTSLNISHLPLHHSQPQQSILETTNLTSTLHWGQKYEPLSVKLYEYMFNTKIELFGCIQHSDYYFIGASPDGINVDPTSTRYGRLLEIKNIVNREITGCPKKEYWVQMQMQMEVCNLNECDFLETKFTEYGSYTEFMEDNTDFSTEFVQDYESHRDDSEFFDDTDAGADADDAMDDTDTSNEKKSSRQLKMPVTKGAILLFVTPTNELYYEYMPLYVQPENVREWINQTKSFLVTRCKYQYVSTSFWRLDVFSCVLVRRNELWFAETLPEIEKIWNLILAEKVTGCEHRAPVRRSRPMVVDTGSSGGNSKPKCLLRVVKKE